MKKISTALFMCIIFYACKKNNTGNQATYPTVTYTMHTNFEGQVYDHSHSSVYVKGSTIFDDWIYWDSERGGNDVR